MATKLRNQVQTWRSLSESAGLSANAGRGEIRGLKEDIMMRRKRLWLAAVLAVAAGLAGPVAPAHAAPKISPGLERLWGWLATVLPWAPQLQATACDWGIHIDPNGGCRATAAKANNSPTPSSDWGPLIDPNG